MSGDINGKHCGQHRTTKDVKMCGVFVNIIKIFIKVDIIFGVFVNIFGCIRKLLANICNIFFGIMTIY